MTFLFTYFTNKARVKKMSRLVFVRGNVADSRSSSPLVFCYCKKYIYIHKSLKAKDVIKKSIPQNVFSHRPLANVDESFPEVREFKGGDKKIGPL